MLRCYLRPGSSEDKHSTLWLSGPFTSRTAAVAREAIAAALSTGPWLILDVDSLTRLDRVGLGVLVGARNRMQALDPGGCIHLVSAADSPATRAVITSGLRYVLPIAASHHIKCQPPQPFRPRRSI